MTEWVTALAERVAAGQPAVLVTVLRAEGSTPREAGAKMVVTADGLDGSVGGGRLEQLALAEARALLSAAAAGGAPAPLVREVALGPALGQCCGGATTLLLEPVLPPRWQVAVFGAGHVGKALVRLLADLPCAVSWVDPRPEEFPAAPPPRVRPVVCDPPEDAVADLRAGADVVVMTHSHALDQQVVEAALRRPELGYVGLIGSLTKRARFLQRLSARGLPPEALVRLTCPIGIEGIPGKLPAEIAIAVAAQLLQRRGAAADGAAARRAETAAREEPAG
jgi:xanthine dehydrogenase accessory factor